MKKVLSVCLIMVLIVSMSLNVSADPGAFISSPSGKPAPRLISYEAEDADFSGGLVVTAYGERQTLPESSRAMMERAYSEIANSDDLTELNADLAKLAADKNISSKALAVSDLFDIRVVGDGIGNRNLAFEIVLGVDVLRNFVGLLHMTKNGVWELVADAQVVSNGEHLKFSVDSLSPFAIVVDTSGGTSAPPETGDNSMIYVYAIIMVVSALAVIIIVVSSKKQRA